MKYIDVFNGDADGICALIQLRNANPVDSELVTGVKRDIKLTSRVEAKEGDRVTVLDISLDSNREGLAKILGQGAKVDYFDHHFAGHEIPQHNNLTTHINTAAGCCTSTIVNRYLQARFQHWAIVGAYGDNLKQVADALSTASGLGGSQRNQLEKLGTYVNYNGYGTTVDDLHIPPAELFLALRNYASPFDFFAEDRGVFERLERGYLEDLECACQIPAIHETAASAAFLLPDVAWACRIRGVYGNKLANEFPNRAHAVITEREQGGYIVSVRAPLNYPTGADEICRQFPSGGGRKAAAGINNLQENQLHHFLDTLDAFYAAQS
ncbi:MAG: acetyltransferase [Proteobacteria bacterium]|nr:MAG: acetyltransferase [Pseudomonadota bacterium]